MDIYTIKKYCSEPNILIRAKDIKILAQPELFFKEFFDLISSAKKSVCLEFYEIADDSIGLKLQDMLIRKAKEGVKVRIIYDSIGSKNTSDDYFDIYRKNSIDVIEYNPIKIFSSVRKWFRRDHRKILIVDFSKCLIGGFNISLDYAPYSMGGRNWKDMAVSFCGQAVYDVANIFRTNWVSCGGDMFDIDVYENEGDVYVSIAYEFGFSDIRSIRRAYRYAIDNARDFIYITNAYFLPDLRLLSCLKKAVMRGVDVRIIVPHKTDHPYVKLASLSILKKLVQYGIKVYEWQGEVLHAKVGVVDGIWVSLGSHNLDHISLHYNLELNINIYDKDIALYVKNIFEKDLENSKLLKIDDFQKLPFSYKLAGRFLYAFRNLL